MLRIYYGGALGTSGTTGVLSEPYGHSTWLNRCFVECYIGTVGVLMGYFNGAAGARQGYCK